VNIILLSHYAVAIKPLYNEHCAIIKKLHVSILIFSNIEIIKNKLKRSKKKKKGNSKVYFPLQCSSSTRSKIVISFCYPWILQSSLSSSMTKNYPRLITVNLNRDLACGNIETQKPFILFTGLIFHPLNFHSKFWFWRRPYLTPWYTESLPPPRSTESTNGVTDCLEYTLNVELWTTQSP
jgi:hypothetical protein